MADAGAQELFPGRQGIVGIHARLEPDLTDVVAVVEEQTHAVRARHDLIELVQQHLPGKVLEYLLPHEVAGLDVKRQPGHHPQRPEVHDHPGEVVVLARDVHDVAVAGHQLERGYGRGEVAVGVAGAVGGRRDRPTDGNVGQGGHVVKGQPFALERTGKIAVANAGVHRDSLSAAVDGDALVDRLQRDQLGGVGDVVEAVARTERVDLWGAGHDRPQLVDRGRSMELRRPVGMVACPVRQTRRFVAASGRHRSAPRGPPPAPKAPVVGRPERWSPPAAAQATERPEVIDQRQRPRR